ncbi:sucrase/ferredoxin-like family protein [Cordyceps javanica]|uniref:Sucrase/ferredoxin-like family protein n=1 Tax=Cordyceps javanica TaxID=43265 RepID=A0A545W3Z7_9HYPO|nr:sucrase/ferredoxin-like family protein [Cordyceps javanica]TQW08668.1 sucrase/ferredoxin-like family protein [Cordyceps javanica]
MAPAATPRMPVKQKMAVSFKSLMSSVLGGRAGGGPEAPGGPAPIGELFAKTDPAVDGDDCLHDCDGCSVKYPRNFKVETDDYLYGQVKGWETHAIVATSKADWVRDSADEKGSVMEAIEHAPVKPTNGKMKLSASNMPTPNDTTDYSEPTTVLLLPSFTLVRNVQPANVSQLITDIVDKAPTNSSPMASFSLPASVPSADPGSVPDLVTADCPHNAVILLCSQKTRDARCGQSAPLLRKEFERHLRPLGLARDLHDERPGGVGIYFIDHVGGHKYSANVMIYRRANAFGRDELPAAVANGAGGKHEHNGDDGDEGSAAVAATPTPEMGAAQCMWLARVRPEDCENIIRYTILKGKLVKPDSQLRGGFDRCKGLFSW